MLYVQDIKLFKNWSWNLYNRCVVAELGAAAASILSQNLERQGFFREAERKKERESEKDKER